MPGQRHRERRGHNVNMQTLSRVREKLDGVRGCIVVTIYPVFSSQPWSQVRTTLAVFGGFLEKRREMRRPRGRPAKVSVGVNGEGKEWG